MEKNEHSITKHKLIILLTNACRAASATHVFLLTTKLVLFLLLSFSVQSDPRI